MSTTSIASSRMVAFRNKLMHSKESADYCSEEGGEVSTATATASFSSSSSTLTPHTKLDNPRAFQDFEVRIRSFGDCSYDEAAEAATPSPTEAARKEEEGELVGTHVSFAEMRNDSSEGDASTSTSSDQSLHDEDDELEGGSQAALMAAIAAATAKKGDEASYTAFFATAEAEAVAAAEMVHQCVSEMESPRHVEEEIFNLIDQHLSFSERNGERARQPGKSTGVSDLFQDLERVLFFTDVVDRRPASPARRSSSSIGNNAIVSSSSALEPWWDVTIREVSNSIYQSGVDAYNGMERTCREVERALLFTDVPDNPNVDPLSPRSAVIITDVSGNETCTANGTVFSTETSSNDTFTANDTTFNETVLTSRSDFDFSSLAARTSETTTSSSIITGPRRESSLHGPQRGAFGPTKGESEALEPVSISTDPQRINCHVEPLKAPSHTLAGEAAEEALTQRSVSPQETLVEPQAQKGSASRLKASAIAQEPELSRVFKSLEKKLLFTDLPDEALPTRRTDRSPAESMASTSVGSAQSVSSSLGMCRSEVERTLFFTDLEDKGPSRGEKKSAKSTLSSQVLADDKLKNGSALQQRLLARIQEVRQLRNQGPGGRQKASIDSSTSKADVDTEQAAPQKSAAGVNVPLNPYLSEVVEDGNSVIATPDLLSDLSSDPGLSHDKDHDKTSTSEKAGPANEGGVSRELEHHPTASLNPAPLPGFSDLTNEASKQHPTPPNDSKRANLRYPIIERDSSLEESVKLLVEVKVNKSRSDITANGALSSSEASVHGDERKADVVDGKNSSEGEMSDDVLLWTSQDERSIAEKAKGVDPDSTVTSDKELSGEDEHGGSWTREDEQKFSSMMDTMVSEGSEEEAEKAISSVLATVQSEKTESAQEDDTLSGWQDCASSLTDTYATAEDHHSNQRDASEHTTEGPVDSAVASAAVNRNDGEAREDSSTRSACGSALPSTETFDALLAEMKDLETAINFDLHRAHTVLRTTLEATAGASETD